LWSQFLNIIQCNSGRDGRTWKVCSSNGTVAVIKFCNKKGISETQMQEQINGELKTGKISGELQ